MGSYTRAKAGPSVGACGSHMQSSDLVNFENRESIWHEFERLGEEEVRIRIQYNVFDMQMSEAARDWLADREVINFGDDLRSVREFARKAGDTASAAHKLGLNANSLAQGVDSMAREAQGSAGRAIAIAQAATHEFRAVLCISAFALIFAVMAFAVAVGAVVFR